MARKQKVSSKNLLDEALHSQKSGHFWTKKEAILKAPVASPQKIICLGLNYRDHAEEGGLKAPDEPIIFMKPHTAIIGPEDSIMKPDFVKDLDYEAELAIVMGKREETFPFKIQKTTSLATLFSTTYPLGTSNSKMVNGREVKDSTHSAQ